MTEQEARVRAEQARWVHEVLPAAMIVWAEERYIELPEREPEIPAPVRDVLVWVVRFQQGIMWKDLAVDDLTGRIVRVEQSRG